MEECVVEKLALIPNHTKLVVSTFEFKSLTEVPETLHVTYYSCGVSPFFTEMIEIFNKRWQTLDVISMMQESKRTAATDYDGRYELVYWDRYISIKESSSSLPKFQKKEEEHSS